MDKNMEKRASKRIPVNIEIQYYLWNPLFWKKCFTGTIKNISEKGMLISTQTPAFPLDSLLEINIPLNKDVLFIPARDSTIVWSHCVSDNLCVAIGVELSNTPQEFSGIIKNVKATSDT